MAYHDERLVLKPESSVLEYDIRRCVVILALHPTRRLTAFVFDLGDVDNTFMPPSWSRC